MVGGIGIAIIDDTDIWLTLAPMAVSGLTGLGESTVIAGAMAILAIVDYVKDGDVLRASIGSVLIIHPGGGEPLVDYSGEMTTKLTFLTETSLKIITVLDVITSATAKIKIVGKKLGQLPVLQ